MLKTPQKYQHTEVNRLKHLIKPVFTRVLLVCIYLHIFLSTGRIRATLTTLAAGSGGHSLGAGARVAPTVLPARAFLVLYVRVICARYSG